MVRRQVGLFAAGERLDCSGIHFNRRTPRLHRESPSSGFDLPTAQACDQSVRLARGERRYQTGGPGAARLQSDSLGKIGNDVLGSFRSQSRGITAARRRITDSVSQRKSFSLARLFLRRLIQNCSIAVKLKLHNLDDAQCRNNRFGLNRLDELKRANERNKKLRDCDLKRSREVLIRLALRRLRSMIGETSFFEHYRAVDEVKVPSTIRYSAIDMFNVRGEHSPRSNAGQQSRTRCSRLPSLFR